MTGYESFAMHELGRTRPTNILEDMLYDTSDWGGSSKSLSSNNSRSSFSSNGSFNRGWNFHSDYKPVPVTDLLDYMRLKPGVTDPIFKLVDDPYVKLPNVARKVVGGFQNDDQKVLCPFVDEFPEMVMKWDSGMDLKPIIDKIWPEYSYGAVVDGEDRKKAICSSKRSKRLARKRFSL